MNARLPWISGGLLFAAVAAWTFTVAPRYESKALLQVQSESSLGGVADAVSALPGASLLGLGDDDVETEIGVLTSRRVLDAVIDSLALQLRPEGSAGPRSALFRAAVAHDRPRVELDGRIRFRPDDAGGWTVDVETLTPALELPATLAAGATLRVGPFDISPVAVGEAREAFTVAITPRHEVRRLLAKRVDARRQTVGAKLIAIAYEDSDYELAARVLERTLAEYREFSVGTARADAGTTVAELRRQVADQMRRLTAAEEELRRYQERTGLVVPEEQAAAQVKRYAVLRGELDALEVQRAALSDLLAVVGERAERGPGTAAYRQLATFPSLITNRAIQDLLLALLQLENDRSALRLARAESNAEVRRIGERISEIERDLERISRQSLEAIEGQIAPMRTALAGIDRELNALPEQETRFLRLYRERTILNEGYLALQKQLRLTEVQDALRLDRVRVVDAPVEPHPDAPSFPRPAVHLVLGFLLAVAGGGTVRAVQSARAALTAGDASAG